MANQGIEIISFQEIEWLRRVAEVLELPANKLVSALINDRSMAIGEMLVYPPKPLVHKEKIKRKRKRK